MSTTDEEKLATAMEAWVTERQELIVLYCSTCGVHQQISDSPTKIQRLKTFCQIMVDYCSAGHFEVFPALLKEAEQRGEENSPIIETLLPKIQDTTDIALDFNDRYETEELPPEIMGALEKHLSKLGEALVQRFEYEDQLIELLHTDTETAAA